MDTLAYELSRLSRAECGFLAVLILLALSLRRATVGTLSHAEDEAARRGGPVALNRMVKEDTLLTFLTLLAFHSFWRGKKATTAAGGRANVVRC